MRVRPATPADVTAIGDVSRAAGQPDSGSGCDPTYVQHVLRTGRPLVAVDGNGAVVGWGADRETEVGSWLTDLFVHPEAQGRGAGAALLDAIWPDTAASPTPRSGDQQRLTGPRGPQPSVDHAGGGEPAGPRATSSSRDPAAIALYARHGLVPRWPLLYLRGPRPHYVGLDVVRVDAAASADAERRLTGVDREADHAYWQRGNDSCGIVVRLEGEPIAAGAGSADTLEHLVCTAHPVEALLAALASVSSDLVQVRLPGPHPALRSLLAAGFRIEDHDIVMATPGVELPVNAAYSPAFA